MDKLNENSRLQPSPICAAQKPFENFQKHFSLNSLRKFNLLSMKSHCLHDTWKLLPQCSFNYSENCIFQRSFHCLLSFYIEGANNCVSFVTQFKSSDMQATLQAKENFPTLKSSSELSLRMEKCSLANRSHFYN